MLGLLHYPFIQNAFIASGFVAVVAGIVGYFLLIKGLTFAADAFSHIGFAGAAGAVFIGLDPVFGLLLFTILSAFAIGMLGKRISERDITTGIITVLALSLGVLFLFLYTGYAEQAYSILFGTVLGISRQNVFITEIFSFSIILCVVFLFRPLLFSSFDPQLAQAKGVPVKLLSIIFMVILAITVSMSVQIVGVLLIFTLLVGPAATAIRIIQNPYMAISLAVFLALIYSWIGIFMGIATNLPVTFFIASLSFTVYLMVRIFSSIKIKTAVVSSDKVR